VYIEYRIEWVSWQKLLYYPPEPSVVERLFVWHDNGPPPKSHALLAILHYVRLWCLISKHWPLAEAFKWLRCPRDGQVRLFWKRLSEGILGRREIGKFHLTVTETVGYTYLSRDIIIERTRWKTLKIQWGIFFILQFNFK